MITVMIQPEMQSNLSLPYPFYIEPDGSVARQDFWKGDPSRLMGFQNERDVQFVDVLTDEFLADPTKAVGKWPVFVDSAGTMYTYTIKIDFVEEVEVA